MKINETIRKYRKEQNLTQEQIANQLGVSAPAVNKWEKGISYPDITLLAPLARLLKIDVDTLLSFQEELSEMEIGQFVNQLSEKIPAIGFEKAFIEVEEKVREFPNCDQLILWSAQILNAYITIKTQNETSKEKEKYRKQILQWFEKVAFCKDVELAKVAQISLAQNLMNNEQYDDAQKMLDKIAPIGFDKRPTQAQLLAVQENYDDAYKIQDEMLYQQVNAVINTLMHTFSTLCKQKKYEDALFYSEIIKSTAKIFYLGNYIGYSASFMVQVELRDKERSIECFEKMMDGFESMGEIKSSNLYNHMKFKEENGLSKMQELILKEMEDDKAIDFIREEPRYQEIIKKYTNS